MLRHPLLMSAWVRSRGMSCVHFLDSTAVHFLRLLLKHSAMVLSL
ncbi:hypothetical protein E2C01_061991 [Portunus trituberculatus]|uniref:Uncharacterized protein n=1 Tax=Portunus trituberculatus TaxID=210409 RepID=A0A5B7HDW4_PORTR|nr:hypothetical protein [Portunus trituberculatus]